MTSREMHNQIETVTSSAPAALTAVPGTGSVVDTSGFESLEFVVHVGSVSALTTVGSVYSHSDELNTADDLSSGLSGATSVDSDDLRGAAIGVTNGTADKCPSRGYTGKKRYVRQDLVLTGATAGAAIVVGSCAIKGAPRKAPAQ